MMQSWIGRYIDEKRGLGELTADTAVKYEQFLRRFAAQSTKPVVELDRSDLAAHLIALGGAASTQRVRTAMLRSFFAWCVEAGLLDRSPAGGLRPGEIPKRPPRFLERDEVGPVLGVVANSRDRLVVELGVQVGLRRKEVHDLNLGDVNWAEGVIGIRGKGHNGEVSRIVPITASLRAALRAYLAEAPVFDHDAPLIRNHRGGRLSKTYISISVSAAMTKAGVKQASGDGKSMHALRHTCAQHLVDDGAAIRDVQALLGHATIMTTETYTRRKIAKDRLLTITEGRSYGEAG
jgi:site-specific recombinase XerD